jgi:hypothetical protein
MHYKRIFPFIILIFSFTSPNYFAQGSKEKNSGFEINNLDRSVSPTKNFYQFSCGGQVKNNPIPDDKIVKIW